MLWSNFVVVIVKIVCGYKLGHIFQGIIDDIVIINVVTIDIIDTQLYNIDSTARFSIERGAGCIIDKHKKSALLFLKHRILKAPQTLKLAEKEFLKRGEKAKSFFFVQNYISFNKS